MGYLLTILALELLLTLHELGHLAVARLLGMSVGQVSIGFGPGLFSFRHRRTEYVIRLIPLGAYFRIRGMNPFEAEYSGREGSSSAAQSWKRIAVVVAGSLTNAVVAFGMLVALYASGTHVPVPMTVGTVEPGSEAARAQLRPGDEIEALDGEPIEQWASLVQLIADNPGHSLQLSVVRNHQHLEVAVRPRPDEQGAGRLGITQQYVYRQHRLGDAIKRASTYTYRLATEGIAILHRMLRGAGTAEVLRQSTQAGRRGADGFVRALVSLSLLMAAFFLLPIPSLDGGRLLFLVIEAARGRPVNPKIETVVHALGLLILIGAIVSIPIQRVARLLHERRTLSIETPQAQSSPPAPSSKGGDLSAEEVNQLSGPDR